eukprot:599669-Rhodomonas_salina.1
MIFVLPPMLPVLEHRLQNLGMAARYPLRPRREQPEGGRQVPQKPGGIRGLLYLILECVHQAGTHVRVREDEVVAFDEGQGLRVDGGVVDKDVRDAIDAQHVHVRHRRSGTRPNTLSGLAGSVMLRRTEHSVLHYQHGVLRMQSQDIVEGRRKCCVCTQAKRIGNPTHVLRKRTRNPSHVLGSRG